MPQGSVLAQLLFLFYVNDLANKLSKEAVIAMFADDVPVLMTARNKADAERLAQAEVDVVFRDCNILFNMEWNPSSITRIMHSA